jgi:hypothetical protein
MTRNIDHRVHYLDGFHIGTERDNDRSSRPAGNVIVLNNNKKRDVRLIAAWAWIDLILHEL